MILHHEDGRREKSTPWISTSGMRLRAVTLELNDIDLYEAYAPDTHPGIPFSDYLRDHFFTRLVP